MRRVVAFTSVTALGAIAAYVAPLAPFLGIGHFMN